MIHSPKLSWYRSMGYGALMMVAVMAMGVVALIGFWTSMMEEIDRQLLAAADSLAAVPTSVSRLKVADIFLSGERVPVTVVEARRSDPEERFRDDSWASGDNVAFTPGGLFKTRYHAGAWWRCMGWKQGGLELRLAAPTTEALAELKATLWRMSWLALVLFALVSAGHHRFVQAWIRSFTNSVKDTKARYQLYLSGAAHELRTPQAVLRAQLLQCATQDRDPVHASTAESMLGQVKRLKDTLETVSLLWASESKTALPAMERVDLTQLLASLADDIRAEYDSIVLELSIPDQPICVSVVTRWLEIILGNLLINAARHNLPASGRISIGVSTANQQAQVTISNTGPSIPPEEQTQLFVPFIRGHYALQNGIAGQGLGLVLARQLARQLCGEVELVSSDDRGTTFRLTLPIGNDHDIAE